MMVSARRWTARSVFVALSALFVLACDRRSAPAPQSAPGPTPAEFSSGERLFDATCARCHGPRGGGTDQGPPLVHVIYEPNHHGDAAFQRAVALGVVPHHWNFGPMPKVEGVSEAEVGEIVGYVRWLQRGAGIE